MRKITAIVLILLILFNAIGYYVFFLGLQYHHQSKLINTLDSNNEDLAGVVSIKIPITIPYANESLEYERINGIFEHKGEFLRFVKQRLYLDTLEIICIKDVQHREINQALVRHAGTMTDKTDGFPASKTVQFTKEYLASAVTICTASAGWRRELPSCHALSVLNVGYIPPITQPPELNEYLCSL